MEQYSHLRDEHKIQADSIVKSFTLIIVIALRINIWPKWDEPEFPLDLFFKHGKKNFPIPWLQPVKAWNLS